VSLIVVNNIIVVTYSSKCHRLSLSLIVPSKLGNLLSIKLVSIFRCSSPPDNPVSLSFYHLIINCSSKTTSNKLSSKTTSSLHLCVFCFYKIIGKLTLFFHLQEFKFTYQSQYCWDSLKFLNHTITHHTRKPLV
jgi:hypothetical protein